MKLSKMDLVNVSCSTADERSNVAGLLVIVGYTSIQERPFSEYPNIRIHPSVKMYLPTNELLYNVVSASELLKANKKLYS